MDRFAEVCENVARHSSRLRKIQILASYLQSLNDEDFALAVRFLESGPVAQGTAHQLLFETGQQARLAIGASTLRQAVRRATTWDNDILRLCFSEVGDIGETAALLLREGIAEIRPLALTAADALYQQLFQAGSTERKIELLVSTMRRHHPLTTKYFVKVITRGIRIGLLAKTLEQSVAQACGVTAEAIREANNRSGDLAAVGMAARKGELQAIAARLFHPMEFMLAKPLDRIEDIAAPSDWIVEDKYDGVRSQVHFENGTARIYSRGMEDVTAAFPELSEMFRRLPGSGILDGEILAWRNERALSFNLLQQRLARKRVRATLQQEVPVNFIAYDLLLRNGQLLLKEALTERRRQLESILKSAPLLRLSAQHHVTAHTEIEALFEAARERGNEGLLLKRRDSSYESGRRSGSWLKLKRPFGTLDVVITGAEQGEGRRAIYLSDYTFGVRSGDRFVNVGKAYSGLTDAEVKEITRLLRSASTEKFGRHLLVQPQIVLEVAFDGVQKSPRHKSGYALRIPRIVRWRRDKKPEDCDDVARVEALYQASLR